MKRMKKRSHKLQSRFLRRSNPNKPDLSRKSASTPYSPKNKNKKQKSKQMKRKCEFDDDSLVLLSNAKLCKKKKRRLLQNYQKETSSSDSEYSEPDEILEPRYSNSDTSLLGFADNYDSSESYDEMLGQGSSMNISNEIVNFEQDYYEESEESDDFFMEKKKQLLDELKITPTKRKKKSKSKKQKNVSITHLCSRNMMIALLDHPASITLYKHVSVEVLSGSISICGHEVNSHSAPVKIFSSERTGFIGIKTEGFEQIWLKKTFFNINRKLQRIICSKRLTQEILSKLGNNTVVIMVEELPFPTRLQFLELYFPHELQFKLRRAEKFVQYSISKELGTAIQFGPDAENMADEIISAIRRSKLSAMKGPVILVYGHQRAGKSTLLKFLVNKVLNIFPSVFYLDADPGQTQFTPPGVVSLTEVNKPIIGPVFFHQQKPTSMVFTGSISAESSPGMYVKSVHRLISLFKENHSSEALFINTMGWLKGIGLECIQEILKAAQPAILGEVVTKESKTTFDYKTFIHGKVKHFQICSPPHDRSTGFSSLQLRDLALLSYFSKCQVPHLKPMYLNEFRPVCVSWDKIPIYIFGRKVPPNRIVEAVNASVVALCHVSESNILVSKIPHFQTTLREEPLNECLGFGIVRAVDEVKHVLYIVTPMDLSELQRVNAIIRGNVEIPQSVFLKQTATCVPLPFTNRLLDSGTDFAKKYRKKIPRRHCAKAPDAS